MLNSGRYINKLWHVTTMEFYAVIKKKTVKRLYLSIYLSGFRT